jgi:exosortase
MILLLSLVYAVGGRELCRSALPAWGFLWLVVPPPMDLDRVIMFKLQNLTTAWSSSILDAFSVYHVRSGNVIEVNGRKLMVEQACSGINSLYSLLGCTFFMIFLTRRGWVRGTLLVAAAIVWVLSANIARVTSLVFLETRWDLNVSSGWRHEALGVLFFALAVGLLLCTDQFFTFLTRSVPRSLAEPQPTTSGPASTVELGENYSYGIRRVAIAAIPAYLLLAIGYWPAAKSSFDAGSVDTQIPNLDKDRLPAKIASWEQIEFASQTREASSFFGEKSSIWRFAKGRHTALVSLDYPFPTWHDLTWCYVGKGWQIDTQNVRTDLGVPGGFLEVRMTQPTFRQGFLVFCEFDRHGEPLTARPGGTEASLFRHQATLLRARQRLGLDPEASVDASGPVFQAQVLFEGYDKLANEEEASLVELFVRTSAIFRDSIAAQR